MKGRTSVKLLFSCCLSAHIIIGFLFTLFPYDKFRPSRYRVGLAKDCHKWVSVAVTVAGEVDSGVCRYCIAGLCSRPDSLYSSGVGQLTLGWPCPSFLDAGCSPRTCWWCATACRRISFSFCGERCAKALVRTLAGFGLL